jgi:hypothetical protein
MTRGFDDLDFAHADLPALAWGPVKGREAQAQLLALFRTQAA